MNRREFISSLASMTAIPPLSGCIGGADCTKGYHLELDQTTRNTMLQEIVRTPNNSIPTEYDQYAVNILSQHPQSEQMFVQFEEFTDKEFIKANNTYYTVNTSSKQVSGKQVQYTVTVAPPELQVDIHFEDLSNPDKQALYSSWLMDLFAKTQQSIKESTSKKRFKENINRNNEPVRLKYVDSSRYTLSHSSEDLLRSKKQSPVTIELPNSVVLQFSFKSSLSDVIPISMITLNTVESTNVIINAHSAKESELNLSPEDKKVLSTVISKGEYDICLRGPESERDTKPMLDRETKQILYNNRYIEYKDNWYSVDQYTSVV